MSAKSLHKQFVNVYRDEPGRYTAYVESEVKDRDGVPLYSAYTNRTLEHTAPFPAIYRECRYSVYPFPGYDLRLRRAVRLAVSLREMAGYGRDSYYGPWYYGPGYLYYNWMVAPPIDGGNWKPVYSDPDKPFDAQPHLQNRLKTLYSVLDNDPNVMRFWVKATLYLRILQDTVSGAGLYARVNLVSQDIDRSCEWYGSTFVWSFRPAIQRAKETLAALEFKRMLSLAEDAAKKDQVFIDGTIHPQDCMFLIAGSEHQLPLYQKGAFQKRYIGISVVLDYGRTSDDFVRSFDSSFRMSEKETWEGVVRCFPTETTLADMII